MNRPELKPITILGAGAWGTALALYLARRGQHINLWSIEAPQVKAMLAEHTNNQYLPGYPFPETIHPTGDLEAAISGAEDILIAVPSIGYRETLTNIKPLLRDSHRFLCATKGMDTEKKQLLHETMREILGSKPAYAILSGPSFAKEVAAGLPTAVVIASLDEQFAKDMFERFNSSIFHIDLSKDLKGVEIGGIVKNVLAIAAGITDGMKLGANARSTLITRGLNEMISLGIAVGADYKTFEGLAGLGDLILTCTDDLSRNRRFGLALGRGISKDQAEKEIGQVVEGKHNAELVVQLAKQHSVQLPICETVLAILRGEIATADGVNQFFG
ncbi:MAG TPA: NAD(P)H-dependent glycerol-3-phosphate dehydrogenase [Gammaproteobacteria bacterium]|nr:NAD(P)H-dependent glycerol-3-phosphate dehydrogenase [Gammaproteobacteria bacterium]